MAGAAVVLAAALGAGPAHAAKYGKPLAIGELDGYGPTPVLADDGTTRVIKGADGDRRYEVATLAPGSSKVRRCKVPELKRNSGHAMRTFGAAPTGAFVTAWVELGADQSEPDRLAAVSAAPGRCFPRTPQVLSTSGPFETTIGAAAGPGGTALVLWGEGDFDEERVAGRWAKGRAGGRFGKPRKFAPGSRAAVPGSAFFLPRDRVLWNWFTGEPGPPQMIRRRAAVSAPGAGAIPAGRQVAKRFVQRESDEPHVVNGFPLPDARGGELVYEVEGAQLYIWSRAPGKPYGPALKVQLPGVTSPTVQWRNAINGAGDSVVAFELGDDVHAVVRRRDGRLGPIQNLTPGDTPRVAAFPEVAIDGAGRAVVTWIGQEQDSHLTGASDVFVAVASRKGSFGRPVVVSGPGEDDENHPRVAVNRSGQVAIAWWRSIYGPFGIRSAPVYLVRGRIAP